MYLHIEDPEQLHATVDRRLHDDPFALMVADATVSASVAASSYARDNRHLLEDDWVSVETIIAETAVRDLVPALLKAGAVGIVEYPLNKLI